MSKHSKKFTLLTSNHRAALEEKKVNIEGNPYNDEKLRVHKLQ